MDTYTNKYTDTNKQVHNHTHKDDKDKKHSENADTYTSLCCFLCPYS